MRVGVAGLNAAGKGEVVRLLERRSFYRASLSDVIRADLAREGKEPTRENMIQRGRALRERFGPAVLAERAQRALPSDRNHVIDSIRHPAEVEALRDRLFFRERPSWDEYFMSIARVVASRSNCIKRKVGSVIALDRRIISTGYNGTPRGIRNCNEGGCPRCAGAAEAGTRLDECLCSHAEENAITQSAYHGVSVRGGTVYTTFCPCLICTKMIINAGLSEVVYDAHFPLGEVSVALFREAGIKVRQLG